jgi:LuxR family transcriptional regulator of csgAB operon
MQPERSKNSRNAEGKNLTAQQTKILAHIAVGATDEEIAEKLRISPHDVKTDIYDILAKIQAPNRLQAALWAATNL